MKRSAIIGIRFQKRQQDLKARQMLEVFMILSSHLNFLFLLNKLIIYSGFYKLEASDLKHRKMLGVSF